MHEGTTGEQMSELYFPNYSLLTGYLNSTIRMVTVTIPGRTYDIMETARLFSCH
jgi:hypothetical protein